MDSSKHILVIVDVYSCNGGASKVTEFYYRTLKDNGYKAYFACNNILKGEQYPEDLSVLDSVKLCADFLQLHDIDVIHYFKAKHLLYKRSVFSKLVRGIRSIAKKPRILITVCQRPSYPGAILTPFEIKHSDHVIFIDKAAYNDPLYSFIPESRKSWIYLINAKDTPKDKTDDLYVKRNYKTINDTIVFGRGSTLNKCPKDLIEVYDCIQTHYHKKFVIVGVPDNTNWLSKLIRVRGKNDIITYPILPLSEYTKHVGSFDIMLYYIPTTSYSSLDGSVRLAMRLGVPVIMYGPPAIKELVIHGVTAFVAESREELVHYAELLSEDAALREKIGRNARNHYYEDAPEVNWRIAHMNRMEQTLQEQENNNNSLYIPPMLSFKIYLIKYQSWVVELTRRVMHLLKR